ncbi:hypothetical protein AYL99_02704 [Fonsecaea erecta]|uniref:SRR1-like domain-containing protein n=1 Tax=Fonsecaea erecta TaxID=1367422 RepID=A0A178ZUP6_9EURO|nr:hypothetical protein AYL99_02704 [Fonsecaea erecta]OAP63477.1 hypothetical protein AYL99_02704 [Fonsecaea erecta]
MSHFPGPPQPGPPPGPPHPGGGNLSDDDGGSDILSAFGSDDEIEEEQAQQNNPGTQLNAQVVITQINNCMQQILHSTTWTAFATYLVTTIQTQTAHRGALHEAVMLGGAPVAQVTPNHPENQRQRSVWQFSFFLCIVDLLQHSGPITVSVGDPLYRQADTQVFQHFHVNEIQQTGPNLRNTFLYMPFLVVSVKLQNLAKGPGIVFMDLGPNDHNNPVVQQWMNALPISHWFQAANLLAGFQAGATFADHALFA